MDQKARKDRTHLTGAKFSSLSKVPSALAVECGSRVVARRVNGNVVFYAGVLLRKMGVKKQDVLVDVDAVVAGCAQIV